MPRGQLDPKDKKQSPTGLRPAKGGKKWDHIDRVGDFQPEMIQSKRDTDVLRDDEKLLGIVKLDKDHPVKGGKLEAVAVDGQVDIPVDPKQPKGQGNGKPA